MADQELTAEISGEAIKKLDNETHSYIRRFGWVFLILSVIDTGLQNFSGYFHLQYTGLFGIVGVIIGVILLYPSIRSVSVVRGIVAFLAMLVSMGIVVDPLFMPFSLLILHFKIDLLSVLAQYIPQLSVLAVLLILYLGLNRGLFKLLQVQTLKEEVPVKPYRQIWGWLVGCIVCVALLLAYYASITGKEAQNALRMVHQEYQDNAHYWVQSVLPGRDGFTARVLFVRYTEKQYEQLIVTVDKAQ